MHISLSHIQILMSVQKVRMTAESILPAVISPVVLSVCVRKTTMLWTTETLVVEVSHASVLYYCEHL